MIQEATVSFFFLVFEWWESMLSRQNTLNFDIEAFQVLLLPKTVCYKRDRFTCIPHTNTYTYAATPEALQILYLTEPIFQLHEIIYHLFFNMNFTERKSHL